MDKKQIALAVTRAECALDLKRKIVGVRFLMNKEEYDAAPAPAFYSRTPYCTLVRVCMGGIARKANLDNFGCLSAARAFGMVAPADDWISGEQYASKHMYRDRGTAKKVVNNTTCIKQKCYGIEVMPVEQFEHEPHIVIIASNAYNMMRLIQGYTYMFGTYKSYKIIGNQALCSECTAYPFESNDINLSTMCAGTRYMAGWNEDELGLGMPFHMFPQVIEGLWATVNIMEPDSHKQRIEAAMRERGLNDIQIEYGRNYYTGLYLK